MKKLYTLFIILSVSLLPAISMAYTVDFDDGEIGTLETFMGPAGEASYEVTGGQLEVTLTPTSGGEETEAYAAFNAGDYVSGNDYDVAISGKFRFVTLPDVANRINIEFSFSDNEWENDYHSQLQYIYDDYDEQWRYELNINSGGDGEELLHAVLDTIDSDIWFTYVFSIETIGINDRLSVTVSELGPGFDIWTTSVNIAHTDGFTMQSINYITDEPGSGSDTIVIYADDFYFTGMAPLGGGVPEPSSIILLILGLSGIYFKIKRKK